jgi:glycosyltransferase involved in cell wall biosynthesis
MKKKNIKALFIHQGFELYGSDRSFLSFCKKQKIFDIKNTDIILSKKGSLSDELESLSYNVSFKGMGRLPVHIILKRPDKYIKTLFNDIITSYNLLKKYDFIYINTIAPLAWIISSFILGKKRCIHVREITNSFISIILSLFMIKNCKLIFNNLESKKQFKTVFNLDCEIVDNGIEKLVPDLNIIEKYDSVFKKDYFNILIPGRINKWKGQDFILKSIKENPILLNNINWIFVGDTAQNQEWRYNLLKEILNYDNIENINFLGWRDDLNNLMFLGDLVVVPSTKPEPFGRVIIEAMSLGKIVLASNHGGPSNIIQNKENGFLFSPNDITDFTRIISYIMNLNKNEKSIIQKNSLNRFKQSYTETTYLKNLSYEIESFI